MFPINLEFLIKREGIEDTSSKNSHGEENKSIPLTSLLKGSEFLSKLRKPNFQRVTSWDATTIINYLEKVIEGEVLVVVNVLKSNKNIIIIDGTHRLSSLIAWLNDDYGDGDLSVELGGNSLTEIDKQQAQQIRSLINNKFGSFKDNEHTEKIKKINIQLNYISGFADFPKIFEKLNKVAPTKVKETKEKEVYFAFLDILGFKDLVENNSSEDLINLYSKIIDESVESALSKGQRNSDESGNLTPDLGFASVNSLVISDSILLWTNNNHAWSFIDLIIVVKDLLQNSIQAGIPLRGAISKGPLVTQQSDKSKETILIQRFTVVGKALVEAYKLESIQEWSGCLIDEKCIKPLFSSVIGGNLDDLVNNNFILKYKVPYKSGKIKDEYVLNWVGKRFSEQSIRKSFSMHNKSVNNWAVELKIRNTIGFLDFVRSLTVK